MGGDDIRPESLVGAGLKPAPTVYGEDEGRCETRPCARSEVWMIYDPEKHRRRSIRLPGYDYSLPGAYFVTACIRNREPLLGKITNRVMEMNPFGQVVRETWDQLPNHYGHIRLDCFAVMPNHVHGIIFVVDENTVGAGLKPVPTDSINSGARQANRCGSGTISNTSSETNRH